MSTLQRFAIRRDKGWRPILALFGGTASRSYVEVGPDGLRAKFGVFDRRLRYEEIAGVQPGRWPWWGGIGWRSNLIGRIGLVASYTGIVDIDLKRRGMCWLIVVPLPFKRLTVSLEDPEGFIEALSGRLTRPTPSS